ncbi:MAG: hypothetical protein ACRDUX_38855 [Mycobacterium sp.]
MPRHADFPIDHRPDLFGEFDALIRELRSLVTCMSTHAEIIAALGTDGRQLDVDQLAAELCLEPDVAAIVRRLATFGDMGEQVHSFASLVLARINAGSLAGSVDLTTYVMATRRCGRVEVWWQDENGGTGTVGMRAQVPSVLEITVLVDAVLVAQAPYDVGDGDWRCGYLVDDSMVVTVTSETYPPLREWYRRAVSEWSAEHDREE